MPAPNQLPFSAVQMRLSRAIRKLLLNDSRLLQNDVAELAIAHRFAVFLSDQFPGRDVDVNYNRHGREIKYLILPIHCDGQQRPHRRVFPDIVIHRRGDDSANLLVIEIKKSTNIEPRVCDLEKLRAFRRQLRYQFGLFLEFETAVKSPRLLRERWFGR